jgi:hypothetical protein
MANMAAEARFAEPILREICCTWNSAVQREMPSRSALQRLLQPSATSRRTSTWRSVSPAGGSRLTSGASCPAAASTR